MGVFPDLDHTNMWRKWRGSLFLLTWIILQVLCTAVSGLRQRTACYNFPLIVDPPCAATEMLLPAMFTLGVSSDVTCHSEIAGLSLRQKGVDEIRRCCQQRENDTVRDYCLPAMKNQLPDHYYLDFVNTCTAATRCQLSTPGSKVQRTAGEDYFTFTFECVQKDTVLHIQHDSTHSGQEVYLYNDQHDGEARANCLAYSHECNSHVIIQLAATRVVSAVCIVDFTDVDVSTKVDCRNSPASRNCSSVMFESKSNYVDMSIFMTVDPGRQEKEFPWIRAKADTGKNVTVVCGANITPDVSLNCLTSASTTTTTSTSKPTTLTSSSTIAKSAPTTTSTLASSTSTSTSTISTLESTTSTSASTATTLTTPSYVAATTATTTTEAVSSNNASSKHTPVAVTCEPGNTLPITLGVSVAVLFVGFVLGWIMSSRVRTMFPRCFYQRQTRKNVADVYNTTSTMEEEHTYSTVQPTSAATYANTSYEYYNQ